MKKIEQNKKKGFSLENPFLSTTLWLDA